MTLHVRLLLLVLIIFLFFSHSERCCRYVLLSHLSNAACFGLIDQTNVQSNNNKAKKEKTSNNRHIVFISLIIIVVMLGIAFEQSVSQPISYSNSQSAEWYEKSFPDQTCQYHCAFLLFLWFTFLWIWACVCVYICIRARVKHLYSKWLIEMEIWLTRTHSVRVSHKKTYALYEGGRERVSERVSQLSIMCVRKFDVIKQ